MVPYSWSSSSRMAEVAVSMVFFRGILDRIGRLSAGQESLGLGREATEQGSGAVIGNRWSRRVEKVL